MTRQVPWFTCIGEVLNGSGLLKLVIGVFMFCGLGRHVDVRRASSLGCGRRVRRSKAEACRAVHTLNPNPPRTFEHTVLRP